MGDWDGIEEVVAVADAGSFAGAARALSSSTSHVSRAVAALEERLQNPLFYRTTRIVNLTDLGRNLVEQFRRIIQDRDEALAWASGEGEPEGEIRISCSTSLGERFIAPIVRQYAQRYPRITIIMDLSNRLVDLAAEGYDLAIRTGQRNDPRLGGVHLASRKLILTASLDYLRAKGEPRSIEELDRFDCLIGSNPAWYFRQDGVERSYRPSGRWRCNSGPAVLDAVLADMGICQLPEFYLHGHLGAELVELLPELRAPDEPIWAVYPQRRHLAPKVRQLIATLEEQIKLALSAPARS